MAWWLWVLLGFALLACELLTPGGFFFLFFGLGAVAVGAFAWFGLGQPDWLEWLLFSVLSLAFMAPLRGRLVRWSRGPGDLGQAVDSLVGQTAVLLEDLAPGGVGKAELRGTSWNVRNAGAEALAAGARVRVERVQGLLLWVRRDEG